MDIVLHTPEQAKPVEIQKKRILGRRPPLVNVRITGTRALQSMTHGESGGTRWPVDPPGPMFEICYNSQPEMFAFRWLRETHKWPEPNPPADANIA